MHETLAEVREDEADRLTDILGDPSRFVGDGDPF